MEPGQAILGINGEWIEPMVEAEAMDDGLAESIDDSDNEDASSWGLNGFSTATTDDRGLERSGGSGDPSLSPILTGVSTPELLAPKQAHARLRPAILRRNTASHPYQLPTRPANPRTRTVPGPGGNAVTSGKQGSNGGGIQSAQPAAGQRQLEIPDDSDESDDDITHLFETQASTRDYSALADYKEIKKRYKVKKSDLPAFITRRTAELEAAIAAQQEENSRKRALLEEAERML
ncbi:hypothetical protein M427DRAFT_27686 [Gonapodya prolifera JEL478]|uniref:Uncharacterized protein n=1 Tax=Gonapodya prolifera (strain JEL478) TaxID=1344416 RepID=A0A139AX41_GONPJ|nr:hypothetical protein M427DRAFT_27686 [Gonapodya prolifera JEL478]|eukprot:KXS21274.1 hypothetical protein M427DRAFT_27686 [Gonapodya prolifera JEL478]